MFDRLPRALPPLFAAAVCATAASAGAEKNDALSYTRADVLELRTIGHWSGDGGAVTARLLKVDLGLEDARVAAFVDWVRSDFADRTRSVHQVRRLTDCAQEPINDFEIVAVEQRQGESVRLMLNAVAITEEEAIEFTVSETGEARASNCSPESG